MKRRGRRALVLLAVGVVAGSMTVAGYAYWTGTDTGSGSASVGTDGPWEVTTAAATGGPLAPNGPVQVVQYTVKNTGTGNQYLTSVTVSVANNDGSAWNSDSCDAGDFRVNGAPAGSPQVHTALQQTFGPGGSDSAYVVVQMVDNGTNQDDCKNATVPLYFVAS
jgi:hypothetical protein